MIKNTLQLIALGCGVIMVSIAVFIVIEVIDSAFVSEDVSPAPVVGETIREVIEYLPCPTCLAIEEDAEEIEEIQSSYEAPELTVDEAFEAIVLQRIYGLTKEKHDELDDLHRKLQIDETAHEPWDFFRKSVGYSSNVSATEEELDGYERYAKLNAALFDDYYTEISARKRLYPLVLALDLSQEQIDESLDILRDDPADTRRALMHTLTPAQLMTMDSIGADVDYMAGGTQ